MAVLRCEISELYVNPNERTAKAASRPTLEPAKTNAVHRWTVCMGRAEGTWTVSDGLHSWNFLRVWAEWIASSEFCFKNVTKPKILLENLNAFRMKYKLNVIVAAEEIA